MEIIDDLPRWALLRSHGSFRILYTIQAMLEDVAGALEAGQFDTAAHQARECILMCLSVRNLAKAGEPMLWPTEHDRTNYNPFYASGCDELDEETGRLISDAHRWITEGRNKEWLAHIKNFVERTEQSIGLDFVLPTLRSAEGFSIVLKVFGEWDKFSTDIGLPSVIPKSWIKEEGAP